MFVNRSDDLSLGHAHASAERVAIAHGGDAAPGVFDRRRSQKITPAAGEIRRRAQPIDIAALVGKVANEDEAFQQPVPQYELLVHAERWIVVADTLHIQSVANPAGAEHVDAGDLELGRGRRSCEPGSVARGQILRQDLCLFH